MSLLYYSRMRFTIRVMPLLLASTLPAHVISVFGPGRDTRDQGAGDLLKRQALHQRHRARVDARVGRSRRHCCRDVERIRASQSRCGIFPTGRVVSVLWERRGEIAGSKWGSVRPEARPGRRCRKVKSGRGKQREGDSCWKSGGGRVRLYT
jgi:hypothetical protein